MQTIYGNQTTINAASDTSLQSFNPANYILERALGLPESLKVFQDRDICTSAMAAAKSMFKFMLTNSPDVACHDARRIMEIPVDAYGGWAFDFFGNFWLSAGGTWVTYLAYCVIMGFALGICIRAGTCLESILQVKGFSYVIFIMTLLLVFENRVQVLFLWTFIVTASAGLAYFARLPIKNENRSQNHSPSI